MEVLNGMQRTMQGAKEMIGGVQGMLKGAKGVGQWHEGAETVCCLLCNASILCYFEVKVKVFLQFFCVINVTFARREPRS